MDKSKWEYKKLGEVCTIERGGSPRPIADYITDDSNGINWIKIGDAVEGSRYITQTKEKIKPEGVKKSRLVHRGDFILSNSMSFGRPYILDIDGCIHDGWLVLHDNDKKFNKDFLYYYLSASSTYNTFKKLAVGGVVNNLNSQLVRGVSVAIPPINDQQRIVAELDCLNEMIALKQEQLKEFDKLAQSIFYDMFGGDTYSKLELASLYEFIDYRGKTPYKIKAGIPLITARNIRFGYLDYSVQEYISEDEFEMRQSRGIAQKGDLLFTTEAPMGFAAIADLDVFSTGQRVITFQLKNGVHINNLYMLYYLMSEEFQQILLNNATGVTVKGIKAAKLKRIKVSIPPLALQQQFAEKIQAIEAQKELVKQSIAETQQLLDSRMDYYFD